MGQKQRIQTEFEHNSVCVLRRREIVPPARKPRHDSPTSPLFSDQPALTQPSSTTLVNRTSTTVPMAAVSPGAMLCPSAVVLAL